MRVLLLSLSTAWLLSCGGPDEHARGRALYALQGCQTCHGQNGEGLTLAPALRNLDQLWEREALIEYFANPSAFVEGDERLRALRERYNIQMPAIMADPSERGALADYVLSL